MKSGVELIAAERAAQVSREGWTPEHDDEHVEGEIAAAAASYAWIAYQQAVGEAGPFVNEPALYPMPDTWPWDPDWWKPKDQVRNLVRAGALIAAELDRIRRCEEATGAVLRDADRRDATRYRFLRELPPIQAQAYFWNYKSRRERDAAIDRDIAKQQFSTNSI